MRPVPLHLLLIPRFPPDLRPPLSSPLVRADPGVNLLFSPCPQSAGASGEGGADPPLPTAGDRRVGPEGALPDREAADPGAVDPRGQGHSSPPGRRQAPGGAAPVPGRILEPVSPAADPASGLRLEPCVNRDTG